MHLIILKDDTHIMKVQVCEEKLTVSSKRPSQKNAKTRLGQDSKDTQTEAATAKTLTLRWLNTPSVEQNINRRHHIIIVWDHRVSCESSLPKDPKQPHVQWTPPRIIVCFLLFFPATQIDWQFVEQQWIRRGPPYCSSTLPLAFWVGKSDRSIIWMSYEDGHK